MAFYHVGSCDCPSGDCDCGVVYAVMFYDAKKNEIFLRRSYPGILDEKELTKKWITHVDSFEVPDRFDFSLDFGAMMVLESEAAQAREFDDLSEMP